MMKIHHKMTRLHHVMTRPHYIMTKPYNVMKKTHHIMMQLQCSMTKPHHISIKHQHQQINDHIRKLWLSITNGLPSSSEDNRFHRNRLELLHKSRNLTDVNAKMTANANGGLSQRYWVLDAIKRLRRSFHLGTIHILN